MGDVGHGHSVRGYDSRSNCRQQPSSSSDAATLEANPELRVEPAGRLWGRRGALLAMLPTPRTTTFALAEALAVAQLAALKHEVKVVLTGSLLAAWLFL
jgi:hypothetical protein